MTAPGPLSWLRQAITERLELARKATQPPWMPEGDDPTDDEIWIDGEDDGWREVICRGPRSHENMLHIAANDPRDVIARCEAELGILDLYAATAALVQSLPVMPEGRPYAGKISARDYMDARRELCVLEPVVSFLAAGYRFHPGYAEAGWGP